MVLPTPSPATNRQIPDHAIMDTFGKQAYLGNQFIASSPLVSLGDTNEDPLIFLNNPATSGKALFCFSRKLNVYNSSNNVAFRLYFNPTTVTSGTAITPINCRIASPTVSIATSKYSPAVVSNGTFIATLPVVLGYFQNDSLLGLIIDPGSSFLITAQASASSTQVTAELVWWEL